MADLKKKDIPYACLHFKVKSDIERVNEISNKAKHKMVLDLQNAIMVEKSAIEEVIILLIF